MEDYSPTDSHNLNPLPWGNLTDAQQRVAKGVAFLVGPGVFDRPTLETQVRESETVNDVVDDKDRLLTSFQYTNLLNTLVEKGYLVKISEGGSPVVFDTRPGEDQEIQSAPFGAIDQFQQLIKIVLNREGVESTELETRDYSDVNAMVDAVNDLVQGEVLAIAGTPSRYGLPVSTSRIIIDNSIESVETRHLQVSLFNQYTTIDHSTPGFEMEATVESLTDDVVNMVITDTDGYIDEAYFQAREEEVEFVVNDAFDVIFVSEEEVHLLWDKERSEEVKTEVRNIMDRFEQQLVTDEGEG